MSKRQSAKPTFDGIQKLAKDHPLFKNFIDQLSYIREHELKTYSPIDAIQDFKVDPQKKIEELSVNEMLNNEMGIKKLLANMLAHCTPGVLSRDDIDQLSGINGREMQAT